MMDGMACDHDKMVPYYGMAADHDNMVLVHDDMVPV